MYPIWTGVDGEAKAIYVHNCVCGFRARYGGANFSHSCSSNLGEILENLTGTCKIDKTSSTRERSWRDERLDWRPPKSDVGKTDITLTCSGGKNKTCETARMSKGGDSPTGVVLTNEDLLARSDLSPEQINTFETRVRACCQPLSKRFHHLSSSTGISIPMAKR